MLKINKEAKDLLREFHRIDIQYCKLRDELAAVEQRQNLTRRAQIGLQGQLLAHCERIQLLAALLDVELPKGDPDGKILPYTVSLLASMSARFGIGGPSAQAPPVPPNQPMGMKGVTPLHRA